MQQMQIVLKGQMENEHWSPKMERWKIKYVNFYSKAKQYLKAQLHLIMSQPVATTVFEEPSHWNN